MSRAARASKPHPWALGALATLVPGDLRPQAEPSSLDSCRQGPRARDGFRAPRAWLWLFQVQEGLEPSSRSRGLRPDAAEASGGHAVAVVTRSRPGGQARPTLQMGLSGRRSGDWPKVKWPASRRQGQGSSSLVRVGALGPWGRFPGEGLSPAAPAPSQTPRGSRTRPRWRRFARRSTRPWRRTANTSTPSSQEGEPRPSLCLDGPRGLFADPLPGAGPRHQPFRPSCGLEGDTLPSPRAVGD